MTNLFRKFSNPLGYIYLAYLGMAAFMLVAVFIRPGGLNANYGFSYYSGYINSGIPAVMGYLWMSFFLHRASIILQQKKVSVLGYLVVSLKAIAILLIFIALTPHNIFAQAHKIFGSALFILQLWLTCVFAKQSRSRWYRLTLVFIELASGIASAYYVSNEHGYLIEAQLLFQIAFALVLIDVLKFHENLFHKKCPAS